MADKRFETDIQNTLDTLNEICPLATYLDESTLSSVDDWIDTGSLVLNGIISGSLYGGVPKGRVIQFVGESQTFKSGFIIQILANAQKKGMTVVIFDTEGAIDGEAAAALGLDVSKVKYINPITLEETRNAIYTFLMKVKEKKQFGKFIIAVDSVSNLLSALEEKRMDEDNTSMDMGTFARSVKSLLKVCNIMSTATKTPILLTGHVYDDPSKMYPSLEKNITGGKSPKYLPSVTVQLSRELVKDDGGNTVDSKLAPLQKKYSGVILHALTTKNRFIKQYLEADMYLSHSTGLNKYYGLREMAKGMGVITNKGSIYYDWEDTKLGFYTAFRNDKELWDNKLIPELEKRIKSEWSYGNRKDLEDVPYEEEETEEEPSEVVETSPSPLEKLKKIKQKVTYTLDKFEKTSNEEAVEFLNG